MDPGFAAFVGVIFGGLITGGVTLASQYLRGRQESDLDRAKRRDDRRLAQNKFQIEALLGIQDEVTKLRASTSYLTRHPQELTSEMGDAHNKSMLLLRMYRSRLDSETIQTLIANLIRAAAKAGEEGALVELSPVEIELLEATGTLLRSTWER